MKGELGLGFEVWLWVEKVAVHLSKAWSGFLLERREETKGARTLQSQADCFHHHPLQSAHQALTAARRPTPTPTLSTCNHFPTPFNLQADCFHHHPPFNPPTMPLPPPGDPRLEPVVHAERGWDVAQKTCVRGVIRVSAQGDV